MPQIRGMFMPGGWKSALNLGEGFPRSELFALNLGHVYAQGVESSPESEARLCPVCRSLSQIWGRKMNF